MGTHLRLDIRSSYPPSLPTSYTFVQSMKVFVIKKCIFKLKSLDLSLNPRKIFKYFLIGFKLKSSDLSLNPRKTYSNVFLGFKLKSSDLSSNP